MDNELKRKIKKLGWGIKITQFIMGLGCGFFILTTLNNPNIIKLFLLALFITLCLYLNKLINRSYNKFIENMI